MNITKSLSVVLLTLAVRSVMAGNDPSIKGQQRATIKSAMSHHIAKSQTAGKYVIFDTNVGELKRLNFKELHTGLVKKAEIFEAQSNERSR